MFPCKLKRMTNLPPELAVLILEELPVKDLVSCRRLTRAFRALVENHSSLQYKIELAVGGMEDGHMNTVNKARKLKMLSQYQLARDTLRHKAVTKLPMPPSEVYDLCGPLAVFIRRNKFTCLIPPSPSKGTLEQRWEIEHEASLKYCCCDLQQDLLILMDMEGDLRNVYFRTLSTNDPHPRSEQHSVRVTIPNIPPGIEPEDNHARVFGDYLGLQYIKFSTETFRYMYTFNVIQWRTGKIVHFFEDGGCRSFAFVDPTHIALASDEGYIEIINIYDRSSKLILGLPKVHGIILLEVSIRSDERPPVWNHKDDPFHVARDDTLLVIDVLMRKFTGDSECRIVVPTWKLRSFLPVVKSHKKAWDSWGPQNAKIFNPYPYTFTSSSWSSVFGSRYIAVERDRLVMYEFHPLATRPPAIYPTSEEESQDFVEASPVPSPKHKSRERKDKKEGDEEAERPEETEPEEEPEDLHEPPTHHAVWFAQYPVDWAAQLHHDMETPQWISAGNPLPYRKYVTSHYVPTDASVAIAETFFVEYQMGKSGVYEGTIYAF